jgi:hypothetical protein
MAMANFWHKEIEEKTLFKILIFKIMPPNFFCQLAEISNKRLAAPGELRNIGKNAMFSILFIVLAGKMSSLYFIFLENPLTSRYPS